MAQLIFALIVGLFAFIAMCQSTHHQSYRPRKIYAPPRSTPQPDQNIPSDRVVVNVSIITGIAPPKEREVEKEQPVA